MGVRMDCVGQLERRVEVYIVRMLLYSAFVVLSGV